MSFVWDQPYTQQAAQPQQQAGGGFGAPGSSNPFYQPGHGYGADRDWNSTPLTGIIREQNPHLAYAQYGQNLGIADNDNSFNRWFYSQLPRFQNAYGMAVLDNPMTTLDEFLQTLPGMEQLMAQFNRLSPTARGLNYNTFAPQARWINR